VLRTSAVGLVVACAFAGASVALGQQGTTSYPQELWEAYPLEQRPATQAAPPASQRRPSVVTSEEDRSGSSLWWFVVAAAGAALVLVAVTGERRRKARPRRAESELLLPESWPAPPPAPPRWSRSGSFFFAVANDPDGTERGIARSPRVDWTGSSPPEQEPEFEAALKVLSKQVRDLGWRPLRARGVDFDERRWYARRFRWPTEAEAQQPTSGDAPGREQVGTHTKRGDA
jgi:hypothetical protein